MIRTTMLFSLAAILGVAQLYSGSVDSGRAQLLKVRYFDQHEGYSRLTITVQGDFQYSTSKVENVFRILLPGTGVAAPYEGARLKFFTGFVNSVHVDRTAEGAIVTVHPGAQMWVRVGRMENQNALYVDVYRDSAKTAALDAAGVDTASGTTHGQVIMPIETISLNSLVPTENSGSGGEKVGAVQTNDTPVTQTKPWWEFQPLSEEEILPMVFTLASSVLGTGLVLLVIRRHYSKKHMQVRSGAVTGFSEILVKQPGYSAGDSGMQEVPRVPEPSAHSASQDATALGLAKKYARGLGEINLSLALKARQGKHKWVQKVQEMAGESKGAGDNMKIAKELGIGRGEVDLAMMLYHLKSPQSLRKELV